MAHKISCADAGENCPGEFTCESKDELVEHAKIHMERSHADMELPPPDKIDDLIRTV